MQLEDLYDYKNQLMKDIVTTQSIVSLLHDNTEVVEPESLVYTQVFPYEYVPETIQEGKTYICFDVDVQKATSKQFLLPTIYVWIFSHKSRLRLPEGGIRVDKICCEISKKINGSRFYGRGELELYSVKRFAPMTDYQGKCMTFYATEVNRVYDPNKPTPANRKVG